MNRLKSKRREILSNLNKLMDKYSKEDIVAIFFQSFLVATKRFGW